MPLPFPPLSLADRVGSLAEAEDPWDTYQRHGAAAKTAIEQALGEDWSWAGKSVLDFGAGAGRTLRHFTDEMQVADFHACDIDQPSVEWLNANVADVQAFRCAETPPLARPDGMFDLVYTISVFTHLLDQWADWLLEIRRVLKPGGLFVASFMGHAESEWLAGIPFDEDRVGMFSFAAGQGWECGGPMVMHSQWWITEHWGKAFDVVKFVPSRQADPWFIHGLAVLRHPDGEAPSIEQLSQPGSDPREADALAHNLEFAHRESRAAAGQIRDLVAQIDELNRLLAVRDEQLDVFARSSSWRLTAPLRRLARALRTIGRDTSAG
jgi:SAM-dependent methyltransferase